ncbi:hypothetical protein DFH09DRAFT_1398657 [Mycena vulgaris]|nr:hypothetical protein DFH09DRAFT_1398657 [Mycena vulgaris]
MPTRRVYLLLRGAALNAATSSLPLPPPPSTTALSAYASTNPSPKLPPSINYGSSPLSLRPSELSLPESPRHLPAFSDTARRFNSRLPRPLCLLRLPLPSDALRLPIDIHHDFPRHFPSSPLHRRRHKSAIEAAYDQQTPTSRRHRPPRNSVRRHATQRSRAVEIPHAVPPALAARGTVLTRSPRRSSADPHLRLFPFTIPPAAPRRPPPHSPARHAACPERATAVVHRRRRPLRLPASPWLQYCRPMLHTPLPPSQRDAQRYSQRQRMPPSSAIASAVDLRGS